MKANNKNRQTVAQWCTLMIVPHGSGKSTLNIKLPAWKLHAWLGVIAFGCLLFFGAIFYSIKVTTDLVHYQALQKEVRVQQAQIAYFSKETEKMGSTLQQLREREQELRELLGIQSKVRDNQINSMYNQSDQRKTPVILEPEIEPVNQKLESEYHSNGTQLAELQSDMGYLFDAVSEYKERFAYTPSIWPVVGSVYENYGMRRHPIFGNWQFHRGVDIPTFIGAPVKAAADGIVRMARWEGGYGNIVWIEHKYGYTTVYGHNSRLLVKRGDRVYKGQIIAKAGTTGISTGPHLHYEVHRFGKSVSPQQFLNINFQTACAKLW